VQGSEEPSQPRPEKALPHAQARAAALALGGVRRAAGQRWPLPTLGALAGRLAAALARELDDRRGFLFLPIGVAAGAGLYFGAPHEPLPYVALLPAAIFAVLAVWAREKPFAFHLFALLAAIAAGFALASLQVQRMAHPVLGEQLNAAEITGFVEATEHRPRGSRVTIFVTTFPRPLVDAPRRVRVTLAGRDPPAVGSHVRLRASLGPPPGPAYPGGFDFGRAVWFDGIGATGYALGRPQIVPAPVIAPAGLALTTWLDGTRRAIAARIRAALPGEEGGVAVALVTGLRDAVAEPIEESMRVAGLSHILSISGLHMALVATTVFFLARAVLALFPDLALRYPIKAWAAVPAALSATFYLLLSGAELATQRAYVMTLIVLAGIVLGRPALTLRTLAVAALAVLALTPWAVLDPGAQMSFAATLALIAAYERYGHYVTSPPGSAEDAPWLRRPARYVAALVLASLAAGLATAPYAAFHFQRLAPLSLVANLAAMPAVSFIVMPAGLVGAVLMPFGWDDPAWRLMGWGIDLMRDIADFVARIPGADRGVSAMPMASLVLLSLALTALCLSRTRLILLAPALAILALWIAAREPRPDLFVDGEARTAAVRGPDGALAIMGDRSSGLADRFAVEQWLSADGDRARVGSKELTAAAACDPLGCTLPLVGGALVALSRHPDSLEDDCRLARVLVTPFTPPSDCAATVIHLDPREAGGGVAGYRTEGGDLRFVSATPPYGGRPWQPAPPRVATTNIAARPPPITGVAQAGKPAVARATARPRGPLDDMAGESASERPEDAPARQ
jgi:competence protein ComEC